MVNKNEVFCTNYYANTTYKGLNPKCRKVKPSRYDCQLFDSIKILFKWYNSGGLYGISKISYQNWFWSLNIKRNYITSIYHIPTYFCWMKRQRHTICITFYIRIFWLFFAFIMKSMVCFYPVEIYQQNFWKLCVINN